jgi:hypothetical protein
VISFKRVVDHVRDIDIELDFSQTVQVDHTFMHEIRSLERAVISRGGKVLLTGFDRLVPVSEHHAASRYVRADTFIGQAVITN